MIMQMSVLLKGPITRKSN